MRLMAKVVGAATEAPAKQDHNESAAGSIAGAADASGSTGAAAVCGTASAVNAQAGTPQGRANKGSWRIRGEL